VEEKINPKYWQIGTGQQLAGILDKVIFHTGLSNQFEVVSFPDKEIYQIKIFKLDISGESFYLGSKQKGFEFFKVEIGFPNFFSFSFTDLRKEKCLLYLKSAKELERKAKVMLKEILCTFWLKSIKSRQ
jgi:hypothetical protein